MRQTITRWSTTSWLLALVALTLSLGTAVGAGPPPDKGPASHIVVFHDGIDPDEASADLARQHGLTREFVYRHALRGASFLVPPGKESDVAGDPRVALMERNQRVAAFDQITPTGINRIDAEGVGGSVDVDIAILDTGVDPNHPDLYVFKRVQCSGGGPFNSQCAENKGEDGHGHGTHVAGTAAALNNTIGVVGVAPGARIWAIKVLDNSGSGWMSWIIAGVDYVTNKASQIEVANMSLGCNCSSGALDSAISNSVAAGVTYAVAAGNSAKDAKDFSPANHPSVITVSAVADSDGRCGGLGPSTSYGADDSLATFSNYGSVVDIAAPGVSIYSTYKDGGYATMSGTSMASPHVAGAAAVYKATNPGASPSQVRSALVIGGVAQSQACVASLNNGYGGFTGDPDTSAEPLVYVGQAPVADTTPPAAPTSLTATAGDLKVALDWADNSESDLAGYNVYRSTAAGGPYSKINSSVVATSAYTDTSVSGGTTYYYVVTAKDTSGNESSKSNEASATPFNSPPAPPAGLTTTAGDLKVTLDWADNTEADLAGYNVYRSTTSGGPYAKVNTSLVTSSAYNDGSVTAGTTYYYVVRAVDTASQESGNSNEASATPFNSPPAAPTGLTATGGDGQVSLDWADNTEGDLAGYNVYRSTTAGGPYSKVNGSLVTSSAYTDTGLTNGTTYYYVARAVDTAGQESANSNEASATPAKSSSTMSVKEVYYYTEGGKDGKQHLRVRVTVVDGNGNAVSSATVKIKLYKDGSLYGSATGTTGSDGKVTFQANSAPSGCYTEELNVTHSSLTWDGITPASTPTDPFCK